MDEPFRAQYRHSLGIIRACFTPKGLCRLTLPQIDRGRSPANAPRVGGGGPWADALGIALDRYFAGQEEHFDAIPLDLDGATSFQQAVWAATREVAWGHTATYGGISGALGYGKRASRAVGQALHVNPVPLVIPCHRIVASGGALGGFGAGLDWKRELLRLEGIQV